MYRACAHVSTRSSLLSLVRGVKMATVSQRYVFTRVTGFVAYSVFLRVAHFTVTGRNEARVDLALIHLFLLYYVNLVLLMLTNIFKA